MKGKTMKRSTLRISCMSCPDYEGTFFEEKVKEELRELDAQDSDWMAWVLGHMFADEPAWTAELQDAFLNPVVTEMKVDFNGYIVKLEKLR